MQLVHVRGVGLYIGDQPFYFAGANCHYLLVSTFNLSNLIEIKPLPGIPSFLWVPWVIQVKSPS